MKNEKEETNIPVLLEEDRPLIVGAYRNLLRSIKTPLNTEDKRNIRAAFDLATLSHIEQRRKTGEPYILHPIEVARICSEEIGLGPTAIVCALLHDVVEDTTVSLKQIEEQFGERIKLIVDGLTKLDGLHEVENRQAENLSKVLRYMISDVRVVLIKMADRLHNMRTIKEMPINKQLKIAAETASVYTPLAHRLGLYNIKSEFQDLCLKVTHAEEYKEIADKLAETKRTRQDYIERFSSPLEAALTEMDVKFRIAGRPKSIYSIWNKMKRKSVSFEEIYDLFAIRFIVDVPPEQEKFACWQVYSIVTDYFKPIPERLKDWITNSKANGYESLHTTVVGPEGRFVEVQIRSERMDDVAERGFAAHWKYKGIKAIGERANTFDNWLEQVRETLDSDDSGSAVEFLADMQSTNIFLEEIHVYTPKGDMKILPEGATALDFAFSIHSDIGCTCRSVIIDDRVVPIFQKLKTGDRVCIVRDKNQKPTEDWLQHVQTGKAKNRIRWALKEEKRTQAEYGREILERKLNGLKVPVDENVDMLAKWFGYSNRIEFLCAIHLEQVELTGLNKRFRPDGQRLVEIEAPTHREDAEKQPPQEMAGPARSQPGTGAEIIINGEPGRYAYSLSPCCNSVPGDSIFAFITIKDGVKIHRYNCSNANNLLSNYGHRILTAEWGKVAKSDTVVSVIITGVDTGPGVIQRLTNRLFELGINIRSFKIDSNGDYFECEVALVVANTNQLRMAIQALKELEWVSNVVRAE